MIEEHAIDHLIRDEPEVCGGEDQDGKPTQCANPPAQVGGESGDQFELQKGNCDKQDRVLREARTRSDVGAVRTYLETRGKDPVR